MDVSEDEILKLPAGFAFPPSHPGVTLAEGLATRGMAANALALKLRVPGKPLSDFVRGRRGISAETALRLGRYIGTGARFWMNLHANYDLAVGRETLGKIIDKEVEVG